MKDIRKVSGVFGDAKKAQKAVQQLLSAHFEPEDILVMEKDGRGAAHEVRVERRIFDWRAGALGGAVGIALGLVLGVLIAVNVVPGHLFSNNLAILMLQAVIGGLGAGALGGYVMGLAMWDAQARFSREAVEIEIGVEVGKRRAESVQHLLEDAGAELTENLGAA